MENHDDYIYIDPHRHEVSTDNFIVNFRSLRDKLREIILARGKDNTSVYFEFLNTGANISINSDLRFFPASLIKVPIAMIAMKKVENGIWSLKTQLELQEQDRNDNWGDLYKNPAGSHFTIEKLIKELLVNSDNTADNLLRRNLTDDELFEMSDMLGLQEFYDQEGRITTKEYAKIFRALYSSCCLSRQSSQSILNLLTQSNSYSDDFIVAGFPEEIDISHKIGVNKPLGIYSDAGIIYLIDKPVLLAILVQQPGEDTILEEENAKQIIKQISQEVYEYINSY